MLPILCHGCQHRFQRTATAVLADDRCPRCASHDIDLDGDALESTGSVSRTGTPSPKIDVVWVENDSWRPGDPPRDPDYADRYFTFSLKGKDAPEPINVLEAMIHDHSSHGTSEYRWEVDATSQWGGDFGEHGDTNNLDQAKAQAAAAVQRASDQFWSEYDDSVTPKGPGPDFPWQHRSSKIASRDYSICPDCGKRLLWGDPEQGHVLKPGVSGNVEDYAICTYCDRVWTEEDIDAEYPYGEDGLDRGAAKLASMATSIKDSNPDIPYAAAVELAREAVRRFPSVVHA